MKFVMNKSVVHNGQSFPKGTQMDEGSNGFNELKEAGHIDEIEDGAEIAGDEKQWQDVQPQVEIEVESDESEEPAKSKKSGKKSK